jgi:glycosyltransferase involved in cell wall biosynthesis
VSFSASNSGPPPPLRILQLNSMLKGGGTDDQCVKLALGLRGLEQNVWIAGPDGREYSKIARELAVPFHATPSEGPLKSRFIISVAKFIRRERIQIVHGHNGRDIWPTILAAKWSGLRPKIVLTRHMAKSPSSWFSRRFLLGQCDALIAVSDFAAKVLREGVREPESPEPERWDRPPLRGNHSKIQVIHGGIDTAHFRPFEARDQREEWGVRPEHQVFAVAGGYSLPRGKGQREFLQATARIHAQIPQARFLIIGRGNMADILRGDIERLGLAGKAWLTPYCRDMPRAMNAIDCLVHPLVGTEAFGLVLLEAFACGRPVIASALDGIPEAFAVGAFGQLIKPDSIAELAAAMLQWARRPAPSVAERAALHARVAENYSVPALGRRMLAFYKKLITPDVAPGGQAGYS